MEQQRRLSKEIWWMIPIVHHSIQYIKNCWVRSLSNYNIKYICTIYTRLDTCLMSISRFSLRDKVTLRLLKLCLNIADVAGWSKALDIRLSDWCCSVSIVWVQIPSRKNKNLSAQRSNSNTFWLNFQTYIFISSFRSDYRRWWSLLVKRNIRQFDYNYSLFADL